MEDKICLGQHNLITSGFLRYIEEWEMDLLTQSLTGGSHRMDLYADFEIESADLGMPWNRTDIVEGEMELETSFK